MIVVVVSSGLIWCMESMLFEQGIKFNIGCRRNILVVLHIGHILCPIRRKVVDKLGVHIMSGDVKLSNLRIIDQLVETNKHHFVPSVVGETLISVVRKLHSLSFRDVFKPLSSFPVDASSTDFVVSISNSSEFPSGKFFEELSRVLKPGGDIVIHQTSVDAKETMADQSFGVSYNLTEYVVLVHAHQELNVVQVMYATTTMDVNSGAFSCQNEAYTDVSKKNGRLFARATSMLVLIFEEKLAEKEAEIQILRNQLQQKSKSNTVEEIVETHATDKKDTVEDVIMTMEDENEDS
ncbi:anamorsin [Tanacetum coccineum]